MIRARLITPPEPAITVDEAKQNMRVTEDAEDSLILGLIKAAGARAEKECGRAFGAQTWEVVLDAFPSGDITVPVGPLVSVTSISYEPETGATVIMDPTGYEIAAAHDEGLIVPLIDWPAVYGTRNAVVIRYVAGLGWPDDIKQAVHLLVGHWYNRRETAGERMEEMPYGACALMGLHRRMFA